jgi:hypothetical protein
MTPKIWPAGTLQRSLADAATAEADGTAVAARDLGARTNPHNLSGHPYVVVTPQLRWVMDWAPRSPEEARVHRALDRAEPDMIAAQANEAEADFVDQLVRAGHVERVPYADGDDADDWDTDDGPANDGIDEIDLDADLERLRVAREAGKPAREPGFPYHVHNPFTARQTWFATFAAALAYARAASAADALDGDLGVWSASGWGEYVLFKGGAPHAEA